MSREQTARSAHRSGSNCSASVYNAFSDVNPNPGSIPAPRSEGGLCGAVLAARKLLREMGRDDAAFEQKSLEQFGSLKCGELRRGRVPCNDLVGAAARLVEEQL